MSCRTGRLVSLRERAREGREAGLLNIGVAAVAAFATLSLLIAFLWLAVASSSAQANQNAADAAALAGAQAFDPAGATYFAPGFQGTQDLRDMVRVSGPCPSQVRAAAESYASKNGATLSRCQMRHWGELEVTTRMEVPIDGADRGTAVARANWSLDWRSCFVDPSFVAPATGSGVTWMECSGKRFVLMYAGERYFLHPWGQVQQEIEQKIRLVD